MLGVVFTVIACLFLTSVNAEAPRSLALSFVKDHVLKLRNREILQSNGPLSITTLYPSERAALLDIYGSCEGSSWTWSHPAAGISWKITDITSDPCSERWQGITCTCANSDCHVTDISLPDQGLSCTFPQSFTAFEKLQSFTLDGNHLYGKFPLTILSSLPKLTYISMTKNQFTGTIPQTIGSKLIDLIYFDVSANKLNGSLPDSISYMSNLTYLSVFGNQLTGTLPVSYGNLHNLWVLDLISNAFTGSIPFNWGRYPNMIFFGVSYNQLTGTIPSTLGYATNMIAILFNHNQFIGSLPSSFGNFHTVVCISVSNNYLTGTFPITFQGMNNLLVGYFAKNKFSGLFPNIFNNKNHSKLLIFDVSDNLFTGTLPTEIFQIPNLEFFGTMKNCLSGTIPDTICDAKGMKVLALSGMSSAKNCQVKTFAIFPSYITKQNVKGSIPSCIFNLPLLTSLYLSGNGFSSTLPNDVLINKNLQILHIQQNHLIGNIPNTIQYHANWKELDLSFNRFNGIFQSNFTIQNNSMNTILRFNNNHLSGNIPNALLNSFHVEVLNGNLFSCATPSTTSSNERQQKQQQNDRSSSLPKNDPDYSTYQCSDSYIQLAYIWALPFLIAICSFLLLVLSKTFHHNYLKDLIKKLYHYIHHYHAVVIDYRDEFSHLYRFYRFTSFLQNAYLWLTIIAVIVFLPTYIVLSYHYSTYIDKGTWVLSSLYLQGFTASIILFILCTFYLNVSFYFCYHQVRNYLIECGHSSKKVLQYQYIHRIALTILAIIDIIVLLIANILYVFYENQLTYVAQISIAFFKLIWSEFVLFYSVRFIKKLSKVIPKYSNNQSPPTMMNYYRTVKAIMKEVLTFNEDSEYHLEESDILYQSFIQSMNILIIPLISYFFVNPTCFEYLITTPSPSTVSYSYELCLQWSIDASRCFQDSEVIEQSTYNPPFSYTYQCSFSFVSSYTYVYSYMFLVSGFLLPYLHIILSSILHSIDEREKLHGKSNTFVTALLNRMTPSILKPLQSDSKEKQVLFFDKIAFCSEIVTATVVLVTFGVSFPPLALLIFYTIYQKLSSTEYSMGILLYNALKMDNYQYHHKDQNKQPAKAMEALLYVQNQFAENELEKSQKPMNEGMTSTSIKAGESYKDRIAIIRQNTDFLQHFLQVLDIETQGIPSSLRSAIVMIAPLATLFHAYIIFDTLGASDGWEYGLIIACIMIVVTIFGFFAITELHKCWNTNLYNFVTESEKVRVNRRSLVGVYRRLSAVGMRGTMVLGLRGSMMKSNKVYVTSKADEEEIDLEGNGGTEKYEIAHQTPKNEEEGEEDESNINEPERKGVVRGLSSNDPSDIIPQAFSYSSKAMSSSYK